MVIVEDEMSDFDFCSHCGLTQYENPHIYDNYICNLGHCRNNETLCGSCADFKKCEECETEFHQEYKNFGSRGVGLTTTVWSNLGGGLTPRDKTWRDFLNLISNYARLESGGSIMTQFEGCEPAEFVATLTPEQEKVFFKGAA